MKRMKAIIALLLCAILLTGLLSGCDKKNVNPGETASPGESGAVQAEGVFTKCSSYEDVYEAISKTYAYASGMTGATEDSAVMVESFDAEASESIDTRTIAPASAADSATSSYAGYSKTNVQVEGIDEGDIVKTDGSYIYILKDMRDLIIAKADGADTTILSTTKLYEQDEESGYQNCSELYIFGDYVAVTGDCNNYESGAQTAKLRVYDVSDRQNPKTAYEVGQDGYILTSRMIDSTIYLVSSYGIYNIEEGDIETYIPGFVAADGARSLIEADSIAMLPQIESANYTIVSAYDLSTGTRLGSSTVLGGYGSVYMNSENLYLAINRYIESQEESYTEGVYTVTEHNSEQVTDMVRFDIASGAPEVAATATVPGSLNNQFSMDEYDGYLRLVTTVNKNQWKTYYDPKYEFTNYNWGESGSSNSLLVLDSGLNILGSVENLAENEIIYSARFDGVIGYFVTFRQVDPLFAVDLSDPANPIVLSALKIPGFSEYLHVYGEGRLLGIGKDANEETGIAGGMKLTMFNTEDPADVTEKHTLLLDVYYSAALDNHKAILVSPEKDVIAFPTDSGYQVYGYSDESGFYLRGEIAMESMYYDSRGLYIGDTAYIVGYDSIWVLDMEGFSLIATVTF